MESYLKLPALPTQKSSRLVLPFWRDLEEKGGFPVLCRMARRLLAIPASSAEVERIFSQAGLIISKKRARLSLATIKILMFCRVNRHLLPPPSSTTKAGKADSDKKDSASDKKDKGQKG